MNKKIGRNDPCPCGSGNKYKECCIKKDKVAHKNDEIPTFSIENLLAAIKVALENLNTFQNNLKKVRVKKVDIINHRDIECQFYPYSKKSTDIKIEIGIIMSFCHPFLKKIHFGK